MIPHLPPLRPSYNTTPRPPGLEEATAFFPSRDKPLEFSRCCILQSLRIFSIRDPLSDRSRGGIEGDLDPPSSEHYLSVSKILVTTRSQAYYFIIWKTFIYLLYMLHYCHFCLFPFCRTIILLLFCYLLKDILSLLNHRSEGEPNNERQSSSLFRLSLVYLTDDALRHRTVD